MPLKEGIIIQEIKKIVSGSMYEYRNNTHEYKFKCTLCGHRWRRLSQVYMTEHIKNHIEKGDLTYKEAYENED